MTLYVENSQGSWLLLYLKTVNIHKCTLKCFLPFLKISFKFPSNFLKLPKIHEFRIYLCITPDKKLCNTITQILLFCIRFTDSRIRKLNASFWWRSWNSQNQVHTKIIFLLTRPSLSLRNCYTYLIIRLISVFCVFVATLKVRLFFHFNLNHRTFCIFLDFEYFLTRTSSF